MIVVSGEAVRCGARGASVGRGFLPGFSVLCFSFACGFAFVFLH